VHILTEEEANYLNAHHVPLSRVIDAAGSAGRSLRDAMKEADALVAVNANRCTRNFSHRMKLRSGHCAQCKPESLGFILRNESAGYLYVAVSPREKLTKVGTASDVDTRIRELNRKGYGGAQDWEATFSQFASRAGMIESNAHALLRRYQVERTYFWAGVTSSCYEIFWCSPDRAEEAVLEALGR
jgi:hypothetical protein